MEQIKLTTMISKSKIKNRVKEMAAEISTYYVDEPVVGICVLRGSFIFYADLIRELDSEMHCEFFGVTSYNKTKSSGEVRLTLDLSHPIEDKHVLLVEDIVDTGLTMDYLQKNLLSRKPKSLRVATLLHKPSAKKIDCKLDFIGFEIPNDFVVGYGLDFQGYYRNLPYIAKVENIN